MQTMRGMDIAYSLNVPADWTVKRKTQDFDALAHRKSLYIGVIAEEANLGDPQTIAKLARHRIEDVGTDIHWSDPEPLVLDGRNWLQFTVDCRVENIPVSYRFYVYSGREGTFQIIGWTMQEFFVRDGPQMRQWMQTFHFPAEKAKSLE